MFSGGTESAHLGTTESMQCDEFRKMKIQQRKKTVRKHRLYWNCLSKGHQSNDCNSTVKCRM